MFRYNDVIAVLICCNVTICYNASQFVGYLLVTSLLLLCYLLCYNASLNNNDVFDVSLQCVICMCAVSSIQTFPCGHKVTCRRCFLRTIQTAIGQRSLALRCVICRTQILSLRDSVDHHDTGYKNRRKEPESRSTFARRLFYVGDCNGVTGYDAPLEGTRGTSRMPHQPANVEFTQPPLNKGDRKSDPTKYATLRNKHQEESLVCRYSRLIMRSAKQYTVWYLENVHIHHQE